MKETIDEIIPKTKHEIDAKINKIVNLQNEQTRETTACTYMRLQEIKKNLKWYKKVLRSLEEAKAEL